MNWNWLDFVLIAIVAASVAEGAIRGFARAGIGLAAAVFGVLFGIWFYGSIAYYLLPYVSSKAIANFIGFLAVFIGFLAGGVLLGRLLALLFKWAGLTWADRSLGVLFGRLLALLFKWAGLTWADRSLGVLFGFVRALVIGVALVLVLVAFSPKPPPRSVVNSHFAPYLIGAAYVCAEIAPKELKDGFLASHEKVKALWAQAFSGTERRPAAGF